MIINLEGRICGRSSRCGENLPPKARFTMLRILRHSDRVALQKKNTTMDNNISITPLKDLYELLGDSRKGYIEVADKAENNQLSGFLLKISQERGDMQRELGQAIHRLSPENEKLDDGTLKGDLHRTWMDIRKALTSSEEAALLDECTRGENYLVDRYKTVMDDKDTPQEVMPVLRKQRSSVDLTLSSIEQLHATFK